MKVFFDTNVLVSALVSRGLCADLFRAVLAREELIVGGVVLDELDRVLREKLDASEGLVTEVLDLLLKHTVVERPPTPYAGEIDDPDDTWILASALAGGADVVVTGDRDLLDLVDRPSGVKILSPRDLWTRLREAGETNRDS